MSRHNVSCFRKRKTIGKLFCFLFSGKGDEGYLVKNAFVFSKEQYTLTNVFNINCGQEMKKREITLIKQTFILNGDALTTVYTNKIFTYKSKKNSNYVSHFLKYKMIVNLR